MDILPFITTGLVMVVVLAFVGILETLFRLGQKGMLFIFPGETKMYPIMKTKDGKFDRVVMRYKGYHLNQPGKPWYDDTLPDWQKVKNELNPKYQETHRSDFDKMDFWKKTEFLLETYLGLVWIGLPPNGFYWYHFIWLEKKQDDEGNIMPKRRSEETNFIYGSKFPYIILVPAAETALNISVDSYLVVEIEGENAKTALFDNTDYMTSITAEMLKVSKLYYSVRSFEELKREDERKPASGKGKAGSFTKEVLRLNKQLPDHDEGVGIEKAYGVKIISVRLLTLTVSDPAVAKALTQNFIAEKEAEALITKTKGEKRAAIIEAQGKAKAITVVAAAKLEEALTIKQGGDMAALIQYLGAISPNDKMWLIPEATELKKMVSKYLEHGGTV